MCLKEGMENIWGIPFYSAWKETSASHRSGRLVLGLIRLSQVCDIGTEGKMKRMIASRSGAGQAQVKGHWMTGLMGAGKAEERSMGRRYPSCNGAPLLSIVGAQD